MSFIEIFNQEGVSLSQAKEESELTPLEGLEGWKISQEAFEEARLDRVILTCSGDGAVNPLHSGGDVHWLGYLEEGPLELILGDAQGNRTSSQIVQPGEYMTFAPHTYHGWIPQGVPAKLIFIKVR